MTCHLLTLRRILINKPWRLETIVRFSTVFRLRAQKPTHRFQPIQSVKIHFVATAANKFPANLLAREPWLWHAFLASRHVQRTQDITRVVWTVAQFCRDLIDNVRGRIGEDSIRDTVNREIKASFGARWKLFRICFATLRCLSLFRVWQFCDRQDEWHVYNKFQIHLCSQTRRISN